MPSPLAKIALLIAASDLDSTELRAFARSIERTGIRGFIKKIEQLRSIAIDDFDFDTAKPTRTISDPYGEVAARVANMLTKDTDLSKSEAINALVSLIASERPNEAIPSPNHTSFATWLERLARRTSPSELLHYATRVRTSKVHNSPSDWPLKNSDE